MPIEPMPSLGPLWDIPYLDRVLDRKYAVDYRIKIFRYNDGREQERQARLTIEPYSTLLYRDEGLSPQLEVFERHLNERGIYPKSMGD